MEKEGDLHEKTKQRIHQTISKARINEKEVYQLVKEFFMELLELDYEFTHEELIQEMQKTYIDKDNLVVIISFLEQIGEMEFTGKRFTQKELRKLLEDLHNIIDLFVQEQEHPSLWRQIKHKLLGSKETKINTKNLKELDRKVESEVSEINQSMTDRQEDVLMQIQSYIEQIKAKEDRRQKKELYKLAMEQYEQLSEEQQAKIYDELNELFKIIKNSYTTTPEQIQK